MNVDALVVGAGPAGLMAAQVMAGQGHSVLVTDQMPSPARKFLMAGKSGLNLTMDQPMEDFVTTYRNNHLADMVRRFGPSSVQTFAHDLGQDTFVGSSGRVFPNVMKASPLLRAWLGRLDSLGVSFRFRWRWTGFDNRFETPDGPIEVTAKATVLALGGGSWARLGSDGCWAENFRLVNLDVSPFQPSNMGVSVPWSAHMEPHFGSPLKSVMLSADDQRVKGECVITSTGIEGSAIYALSRSLRNGSDVFFDLVPDLPVTNVEQRLTKGRGKASVSNWLRKALKLQGPKQALLQELARPLPSDPAQLANLVKNLPLRNYGLMPLDQAISTAGGFPMTAVDDGLMIRQKAGFFCAGEMLDWDAPTGGYLITACLATGRRAGEEAIKYLSGVPS